MHQNGQRMNDDNRTSWSFELFINVTSVASVTSVTSSCTHHTRDASGAASSTREDGSGRRRVAFVRAYNTRITLAIIAVLAIIEVGNTKIEREGGAEK